MNWISTKTSLPLVGVRVFIYVPSAADEPTKGFFAGELGHPEDGAGNILNYFTWWCEMAWFNFEEVSHWMLPEAPK